MQVFKELKIQIDPTLIQSLIDKITGQLESNWTRNFEREKSAAKGLGSDTCFCFNRAEDEIAETTMLVLMRENDNELYVSNIVPVEVGNITKSQYNSILTEFYQNYLVPLKAELEFVDSLTSENQTIDDWVSPECARLLRAFSNCANKGTGSHHPSDQERWFDFIFEAQKQQPQLEPQRLKQWLIDDEKWPEEVASDLASEYNFGIELLNHYVRNRR